MRGRFTNELTLSELQWLYKLTDLDFPFAPPTNLQPRYNIAPTQQSTSSISTTLGVGHYIKA